MMTRRLVRILVVVLAFCATVPRLSAVQASSAAPVNGQTATLLPNGGVLLAGGQDASGHASAVLRLRDLQGTERQLQAALQLGRTGHTATVLPDGTVLILGGIGADGQLVTSAEIFDPQSESSQLLGSGAPSARAFHSATVLTDGRVLISGGVGANGEALASAELWDARRQTVAPVSSPPSARRNHAATLLPDGRVLLTGGKDASGKPVAPAEAFDPQSQTFSIVDAASLLPLKKQAGQAQAFSPQDGAANVPIDALIALRFSRVLRMESITDQTIILNGPSGMVEAKIVGAEAGMLAFITPQSPLLPGTTYLVRLSGAVDADGTSVVFKEFTFTTAGDAPQSDVWNPTLDWMTHNSPSTWQNLPPLRARAGVTAFAGQVLKLDGTPLAHVKLQIGAQAVFSDGTGRFLLENLAAGHNVMMIFGDSANTPLRKYGVYEVGVDVKGGITNVLSYVIWMTPLDTAHAVKIPSPTMAETVVTSPLLPGLELHLPANTVITDARGNTVTEITITPVPLDRPPFPLPRGVPVPIYFTIQPGVSYIKVLSSNGPKGARLFYPNAHLFPPRTPFQFWNYDADKKGWFIYGQGHVSADRSQVVPDPGVEIYEFTGAMVSNPGNGPGNGPHPGGNDNGGDPVDLSTGLFVYEKSDLFLPDLIPLALTRTYRQSDPQSRTFGVGASMPYDMFLVGDNNTFPEGYTFQDLFLADGGKIHFQRTSPCTGTNGYCDFTNAVYEHTSSSTDFYGAIIRFQGCSPSGSWTLTKKDGTVYCFPDSDASNNPRSATPNGMQDRNGNTLVFAHDSNHNLTQITSPGGRWIQFTYDASNRVTQAKDNIGRTVSYSYDAGGRLIQVTDANGGVWNYTYDAFSQMTSVQDARGVFYLTNQYDQNGRVIRQTQGDNSTFLFSYTTDPGTGNITQADVTDPRGVVNRTTFTANGYNSSRVLAVGKPEQQTLTYTRDPNTNLISSMVDALSRTTTYAYDAMGNTTSITRLAGTPNAVTATFTYEPAFNQMASFTDPLNHTTTFSYDGSGNLVTITDTLGHQASLTYNNQGLPVSITDPAGNTVQMGYDGTDLVSLTDGLGNTTTRFVDSVGRLAATTNAAGQVTRFQYNPLNELLQITDPLQQVASFSYDPNGNMLSRTDPLGHTTSWTYNNMERVASRTDPLLRQETYSYDAAGNLVSMSDRKGQVTTYGYDNLNRLNFAGFGTQGSGGGATYQSTISYQYDAADRPTQSTDSLTGIITNSYDGLDRVLSETTPQGSITYAYDAGGRRTSMTVAGQPAVSYTYDNANRLTQITQGTANSVFSYDNANRRLTAALPNGVSASYSYDNNSHLTGIAYSLGGNTLGTLSYGYDVLGRRTQVSGSLARTGLPQPVNSASYDAANEMVNWNGVPMSYDANGSLLSDGSNTLTWDARGQLSAFNATGLSYDALGRRVQGASGASFLYDGVNLVQQLSGTTPTANLLTGNIDQFFTQADATGTVTPLRDVLGSTVALTDATGNIVRSYIYDPFGNTVAGSGSASTSFQYTGRENDGTGFYYYRARYYSPALQRFISEDPLGPAAFDNLYAYTLDSPLNLVDPHGTCGGSAGDYGASSGAGAGVGTYVGMSDALDYHNNPTSGGQARLGYPDSGMPYNWNRNFHLDYDSRYGYHFNADSGPLSGFNHASIPGWMDRLGNTDVMRNVGRAAGAAGAAVDAYRILTSGRKQRPGAIGGAAGGWAGAEAGAAIGTAIAPGIGTIIGGLIGGLAGGAAGQWAGDQVSQSMYGCN